jgi:hypothetical protein
MWHQWEAGASFLSALVEVDRRTAEQVRRQPCRCCRGPLHAGHYGRKPRGLPAGLEAQWLPEFSVRWSLCCGHCRRRTTPPSVRFLGRKVYVGFVVFLAVLRGLRGRGAEGTDDAIGRVPRRTVRRWAGWWSRGFADHPFWRAEGGRFAEPVARERLPGSLLERFRGTAAAKLVSALCFVAPITTETASSVRVVWTRAEDDI